MVNWSYMSTTLQIDSFPSNILRERTRLSIPAAPGDTSIVVESFAGYDQGDIIYVGNLGRETCEKAVVASVDAETTITLSGPIRGDDFGHYASITEIRNGAGFGNAVNLADSTIDQQRRAAESEINAALAPVYKTPFDPVPKMQAPSSRRMPTVTAP